MAATYGRPGVTVTEVMAPRDTGYVNTSGSRSVLVADLDRGPTLPTTVASWAEFRSIYGDWGENQPRAAFGHKRNASVDAAYLFFANNPVGGAPLTVLRVVNSDALAAQNSIIDDTGQAVMTVVAASPGLWGNRLRVSLYGDYNMAGPFSAGDFASEDFDTPVGYAAGTMEFVVEIMDPVTHIYRVVERFSALSMRETDRRYAEYIINGSSNYVNVAVGSGNLVLVSNRQTILEGGSEGDTPADLVATLQTLDFIMGALTITYSGHWNHGDLGEVSRYVKERGDSFHIVDTPDLSDNLTTITDWVYDLNNKSAFSAAYYPPVVINDPAAGPNNIRRSAPCGGAVLGVFAATDSGYGMWRTPAGVIAGVRGIVQPLYKFTNPQLDQLNTLIHPVNPIRVVQGVGPCIMGGRTLDQTHADRYVGIRRSFSFIRSRLEDLTEFAVFEVNGPDLWETITFRLENFLGLYFQEGALRGARESEAFYVRCDSTNNTQNTISAGEVHVEVGVALEYPAEFIVIKLTQNQSSVRVD